MDNLIFYDVDAVSAPVLFDLGNVAPSSSADSRLRVDNPDDTYQAENVTVSVTGTDGSQLFLSRDGEEFRATIDIGDIPPNGSSPTFWLRRVTPSTASGTGSASLVATPASWTVPVDLSTSVNVPLEI